MRKRWGLDFFANTFVDHLGGIDCLALRGTDADKLGGRAVRFGYATGGGACVVHNWVVLPAH